MDSVLNNNAISCWDHNNVDNVWITVSTKYLVEWLTGENRKSRRSASFSATFTPIKNNKIGLIIEKSDWLQERR
jgi:hypothetical protein